MSYLLRPLSKMTLDDCHHIFEVIGRYYQVFSEDEEWQLNISRCVLCGHIETEAIDASTTSPGPEACGN